MFFTREDILKIQQALLQLGVKDSELPSAEPVTYNDTLSIIQDGKNKQIEVKDFFNQISLWKREDFLNITDRYDEHYIMLLEAINLVPILQRKDGLVITFQDTNGDWRIYQFRGNIIEFLNEKKWFDLYDYKNYIIKSFLPDEEDITALTPDENGNSFLALKDRIYDSTIFSGKGYKFVRKNIINIELAVTKISVINSTTLTGNIYFKINNKGVNISLDALTHNTTRKVAEAIKDTLAINYNDYKVTVSDSVVTLTRKYSGSISPTTFEMYNTGVRVIVEDSTTIDKRNIITQEDINKTDTIYEIRYDFDLDGKIITIPKNCILYFTSGKFYNGSINMNNTIVSTFSENALSEVNISGNYYNIQKSIKDANNLIQGNTNKLNNAEKNIERLDARSFQIEETIKGIAVTGGASQASAVTYENTNSGLNSINAQGAIDELAVKMFNKENVSQEFGNSKDKVVSQFALPFREIESPEFIKAIVDTEDHFLFGIQLDGSIEWGKGIPTPIRTKLQEIIKQCQQDKTNILEVINAAKKELSASITALQEGKVDKEEGKSLIEDEVKECFKVIENEEFIKAVVDSEDRVLYGIYKDTGKLYYPQNDMYHISQSEEFLWVILDTANHPLLGIQQDGTCWAAKAQWLDDIKTIKKALSSIDETFKTFQPKEDDKGLINLDVADSFFYISNDEYIIAVVDSESRILTGIKYDGEPYFPNNEMYSVITNEEWLYAIIDAENKVLGGFRANDGHMIVGGIDISTFIANAIIDIADIKERTAHLSTIVNDEYLSVETDAEGKVIGYIAPDGSHYLYKVKSETIPTEFSHIEDPEGRTEITTDVDDKVVSYRDTDGKKHEHDMEVINLDVSNINLKGNSVNNIQDALKANGFDVKTPIDWSESSFIQISEPRFAIINVSNIDSMPTTKTQNKKAFLEFWDMQGNYFKKHAILNAQGNSSLGFVKKNVAIDLCDDEWIGDDTPKVRIGNWVPQDSFHMKAYYTDFFRGVGAVSYKLYDQIVRTRGNMYDRPWKKALLDMSKIGTTTKSLGNPYVGDYSLLTDTGARCFPDGFPVAVYLNGEFYGIFSWQLKKHRDNYHMNKSSAEHVHLDGTLDNTTIFNGKDNIDWSQFEIRNPKGLYAIGGNKYDADIKQEEIAGAAEVNIWIAAGQLPDGTNITNKIKKNLQITAKVKSYIQNLSDSAILLEEAMISYENSNKTAEDFKTLQEVYEQHFCIDNFVDYLIMINIIDDGDSLAKNWQWITYDGIHWFVNLYDCDVSFGAEPYGRYISSPYNGNLGEWSPSPSKCIIKYFSNVIDKRYKDLSDMQIINADNIFSILKNWTERIGTDYYIAEFKKWNNSPCISDSIVRSEYWEILFDENKVPQTDKEETFDAKKAYNIGDVVSFGIKQYTGYYKFKCIAPTQALANNTPHSISTYSPILEFRHCDSLYRVEKWIISKIKILDKLHNYNR